MRIACLAGLAVALLALSCAPGKVAAPALSGSSWTLLALGDAGTLRTVSVNPPVVLEFSDDDMELSGTTGCNGYGGHYEATEAAFRTVDVMMSERACPTRELAQREREYVEALADAQRATVVPGWPMLVIDAEDERLLIFGPSGSNRP